MQLSGQAGSMLKAAKSTFTLLQEKCLINGNWVGAVSGRTFDVKNPATGCVIGSVPDMDVEDTKKAVEAAKCSFQAWKHKTAKERSRLLREWFNLMDENQESIAEIMTAESGKPLAEARGEVTYGNSFVEWFSEEARRIHGEIIHSPTPSKKIMVIKQPIGVAALITPWNFPHAMIARKAGAALASGCTCVIKPAEDTPLTALIMAQLAQEAGIPDGVVNVVTSDRKHAPAIGKFLCESPDIAGVSFTGSTAVGKLLYNQCASGIKRIGLELGGNAPFIVFNSANAENAAAGAIASKFRNCGQTCVSANRFLVQESIYDEFIKCFVENIKALRMGNGASPDVTLGPLINHAQLQKVSSLVEDAVAKGAKVVLGGKPAPALGELFYEPTVVTGIRENMRLYEEEVFGPVVSVIKFKTEEEAVCVANSSKSGLAGYFYSEDVAQIFRVGEALEVGMVGINEGIISTAEAPFGGVKESGLGREGSHYGIEEYTYVKYLCLGNM